MAIKPLVHLNGSSRDDLMDTLTRAAQSLTDALRALADAAPNARDYYPLGDDAWRAARDTHERHMNALREMRTEYQVAMEHVQDQIDAIDDARRR